MTMESLEDYASKQLELADEALSDARYLLEGNRLKAAANRAYYAMFHAAHAAIFVVAGEKPRTHAGALNLFGRYLIRPGLLDRQRGRDLQDAYDLRQDSDYEVDMSPDEQLIAELVEKAEVFIEVVKALVERGGSVPPPVGTGGG